MKSQFRLFLLSFAIGALVVAGVPAHTAKDFPNRMMTWIVPFSAGGGSDILSRIITSSAYDYFEEQPWRVVNRSGASGVVGWKWLLDQPANGYTVLQSSPTAIIALVSEKNPPIRPDQIKIVGYINTYYSLIAAQPGKPWSTWEGFKKYAVEHPGDITLGGTVSGLVMAANALQQANLDVTLVSYNGNSPAITDLLGGHIKVVAASVSPISRLVPEKAVVVLNTGDTPMGKKSLAALGKPPSAKDVGLKGLSFPRWVGVHPDTPDDIARDISKRLEKTLKDKAVKRLFGKINEEIDWVGMDEAQARYRRLLETLPGLLKKVKGG